MQQFNPPALFRLTIHAPLEKALALVGGSFNRLETHSMKVGDKEYLMRIETEDVMVVDGFVAVTLVEVIRF